MYMLPQLDNIRALHLPPPTPHPPPPPAFRDVVMRCMWARSSIKAQFKG